MPVLHLALEIVLILCAWSIFLSTLTIQNVQHRGGTVVPNGQNYVILLFEQ